MKLFSFNTDFLQDTEGGQSMKRLAFAVFVIFFVIVGLLLIFHGIDPKLTSLGQSVLDKTEDLIKWLGALILGDKVPSAIRAFTGTPKPPEEKT